MFRIGERVLVINRYDLDVRDFYESKEVLKVTKIAPPIAWVESKSGRTECAFISHLQSVGMPLNRRQDD